MVFEKAVLQFLGAGGTFSSVSKLTERLADYLGVEYNEPFRSQVQYNVSNLEQNGYVNREKHVNRLEAKLSKMGDMWMKRPNPGVQVREIRETTHISVRIQLARARE